jgi:hypothetical protein
VIADDRPAQGLAGAEGIAARVVFPGSTKPPDDICDGASLWVPVGATTVEVRVQQGIREGFCPFDPSLATRGSVRAVFS